VEVPGPSTGSCSCLNWSLHWAWLSKGFRCPAAIVSVLRGTGWLEPDRLPVQLLLVGLMFVSLLMSVAIAEAFGGRAWLFVAAYLLLQVERAVFLIVALRGRALGEHFVDVLVWELIAGGWPVGCWGDR
jgi:low temperature requirement protein LtrA